MAIPNSSKDLTSDIRSTSISQTFLFHVSKKFKPPNRRQWLRQILYYFRTSPARFKKVKWFILCKRTLLLNIHQFYSAKTPEEICITLETSFSSGNGKKPILVNRKLLKETKNWEKKCSIFFSKNAPGKLHRAENPKETSMRFVSSKN